MRVAEHALAHEAHVHGELRLRVEAAAGVVEVDVGARVEAPVLGGAELVEQGPLAEGRIRLRENGLRPAAVGREEPLSRWSRLRTHRAQLRAYSAPVAAG